jgi:hypothetical protein
MNRTVFDLGGADDAGTTESLISRKTPQENIDSRARKASAKKSELQDIFRHRRLD